MLSNHLRAEYCTMTPEELERNRSALSEPWNLDDPIKDLWSKISNIQRIVTLGHVPIPDVTMIITLTLAMIEKNGMLVTATEKFRLRTVEEWTASFSSVTKNAFVASPLATLVSMARTALPSPRRLPPKLLLPLSLLPQSRPRPPPPDPSRSKAAACITVGLMALVPCATIPCSLAIAKLKVTRTMP